MMGGDASLLPRLYHRLLSLPVRAKILAIVLGVVVLLASVVTVHVRSTLKETLREELRRRAVSVAQDVAGRATDLMLTDNLFALEELIRNRVDNDQDVRYVLVIDRSGEVVAHTFGQYFPAELLPANTLRRGQGRKIQVLETEEGLIWDAAVAILEGKLGVVRVGMSERRLQSIVAETTHVLVLVTLGACALGLLAAYLMTSLITHPILELVQVTEALRRGDLRRRARVKGDDEVGRLGRTFNAMVEALEQSRREIEEFNQELLRRNEELSVLNATARTVGASLELPQLLSAALQQVLDACSARAAWVFLRENDSDNLMLVASCGLSGEFVRQEAEAELGDCICRQVLETAEPQVLSDMAQCGRISRDVLVQEGLRCHVSVPLKAVDKVLGILNVARDDERQFAEREVQLLTSIGHQIGMAIENAMLYGEVQQKDALRRQLLDRVIEAQEEERKRVARELHDRVGQNLTGLIMALGSVEASVPADATRAKEQLSQIRSLLSTTVDEIRRLMLDLRPALLDDLGLVPAIRAFAQTHLTPAGVDCQIQVTGTRRPLPAPLEIALFRIVQEAVTNIVKHASAQRARISIHFAQDRVSAVIQDDGVGFQPTLAGPGPNRLGLVGMEERATLVGGTLRVFSQPNGGTQLKVELPLSEA